MLIARAETLDGITFGVVENGEFRALVGLPYDAVTYSGVSYSLSDVGLLCPVPANDALVILGGYRRKDRPRRPGIEPILYAKSVRQPVDPGGVVVRPQGILGEIGIEPELAVVIGKQIRAATPEVALASVFGYTVYHDVSALEYMPFTDETPTDYFLAKCPDTFASCGPYINTDITTADVDAGLAITARVNGEIVMTGDTQYLRYAIANTVATACRYRTLQPGDIISTGTPAIPAPLRDGDVIEIEIERIGVLINHFRDESSTLVRQ